MSGEKAEADAVTDDAESKESGYPLPFNLSLDKLDLITKAFFQAKADQKPVQAMDLEKRTGVYNKTIRANARFLTRIGVLKFDAKTTAYTLTEQGASYAKLLSSGDIDGAGKILSQLMPSSHLRELLDYIELHKSSGDLEYQHVFSHIKTLARLKEDAKYPHGVAAPYSAGITTLIDLMIRAQILPNDIRPDKETATTPTVPHRVKGGHAVKKETPLLKRTRTETSTMLDSIPITINITIEAKDAEVVKQLILLLRDLKEQKDTST